MFSPTIIKRFIILLVIVGSATLLAGLLSNTNNITLRLAQEIIPIKKIKKKVPLTALVPNLPHQEFPTLTPPKEVNAFYITASSALTPRSINHILNVIENSAANAAVVNVKESNGIVLTPKIAKLVKRLRAKNIYPIARIVLFQDNELAKERPEFALKDEEGELWGKGGYRFIDPSNKKVWDYNIAVANEALDIGFAEINFDYVRFPDGYVDDIVYPFYKYDRLKKDVINEAVEYINGKIREKYPEAIISLDIFAYAFLRTHDVGIGQKLTDLADHYDVIAPMIYPSHYGPGNFGFENPAEHPYQVVLQTLQYGINQLKAANKEVIIRPWIQDFDMGAVYDKEKIQQQIKAIKDAGLNSGWMVWNPSNFYIQDEFAFSEENQ
jgi:hypothetical protein